MKKSAKHKYHFLQMFFTMAVTFFVMKSIFRSPSSGFILPRANNPELFELTESDSLFQLVLKLYWIIWCPILCTLQVVLAVKIIECIEDNRSDSIETQQNKRWDSLFSKLERISKAIGSQVETASKKVHERKQVNKKPSRGTNYKFNLFFS